MKPNRPTYTTTAQFDYEIFRQTTLTMTKVQS